jgi:hypothetical protein
LKTKIKFRDKDFEVDREINKSIYGGLRSDAEDQKHDNIIRFYLSNRDKFFTNELVDFLNSIGIDWTKENELFHYGVEDDQTIVEGWYDIVGNVLSSDKVVSFYWGDDLYTTNIFFQNETRHGISPQFTDHETFRFGFSIVLQKENVFS